MMKIFSSLVYFKCALPQWNRLSLLGSSISALFWSTRFPCRCSFYSPAESFHWFIFMEFLKSPSSFKSRNMAYEQYFYPLESMSPQWVFLMERIFLMWTFSISEFFSFVATSFPTKIILTFVSYASWGLLGTKICFYMLLFKPILLSRHEDFNLRLLS